MGKVILAVTFLFFLIGLLYFQHTPNQKSAGTIVASVNSEINKSEANNLEIVSIPAVVEQGEPVMLVVENATSSVQNFLFGGKPVKSIIYNGKPTAIIPIDLNKKAGIYAVSVGLADGTLATSSLTITARPKSTASLGIPAKLGGNTTASQKSLVSNLTKENAVIKALPTATTTLWNQKFIYPLANPVVTDPFGYSRLTGAYTITHLGADLRAEDGTPVMAMNRGKVTFAKKTVVYGNMIVIDHGLGLETVYAHLSKIKIKEGEVVEKGKIIGDSGHTGYAEQPHLHFSIKINNISVDPVKFLELFK